MPMLLKGPGTPLAAIRDASGEAPAHDGLEAEPHEAEEAMA